MAEIHADQDVVIAVATQLLKVATDPNQVSSTHGDGGRIFFVPDWLAEKWFEQYQEGDDVDVTPAPKKKGK
jgi:hypothetical protein